ncbi:MAG TPA: glutathione transferase GstA [Lysobacter sp.]|nr:glutathione transferase GstA [Lysobacter sp.]
MKLYYVPGTCSLAPHIIARELGIDLKLEKVDFVTKTYGDGRDFNEINPKGYVPALELDNGEVLTEGPAIMQYLADLRPEGGLAPANGTFERVRLQELLGYINSELHKSFGPLWNPASLPEVREERSEYLRKRFGLFEKLLAKQPYLMGDRFTVADVYLFVVAAWSKPTKFDLSPFPVIQEFQKRIGSRPAVQQAMVAEGLIKAAAAA